MKTRKNSQISKFYKKSLAERHETIQKWINREYLTKGLTVEQANSMVENVIDTYELPYGIATNFKINEQDYLIPMVIEEPSVIAAVSYAAKLFRSSGGFISKSETPITIGQIQVLNCPEIEQASAIIKTQKNILLEEINAIGGSIVKRGGGAKDITTRIAQHHATGDMLIIHVIYDSQDAMGANAVNTALEHIAPVIEQITKGRANLRILSNLADKRVVRCKGMVSVENLDKTDGIAVSKRILEAAAFAEIDPYRATTHNKGIMNGIDAVLLATGNDWRAVEAGAHAFAARDGSYSSLTRWWQDENHNIWGEIAIPLALGIVGGATRVHPKAQLALTILGVESSVELGEIIAAVGLAQNFAAMRALATEGIQKGHMRMHAKQLAVAAGASLELVPKIVEMLIQENNIRLERAKELVQTLSKE